MGLLNLATRNDFHFRSLLNLLKPINLIIITVLNHLGLLKNSLEQPETPAEQPTNYVFVMDGPCPSLVTIPVQNLILIIKKRVPVIEYRNLVERSRVAEEEEQKDSVCVVCLESVEESDEIRDLPNCCHVFHKECLDCWIDECQVTCPVCRSMLLPAKGDRLSCGFNPWLIS